MHLPGRRRPPSYVTARARPGANKLHVSPSAKRGEPSSLTASGQRIEHADIDTMRRLVQPWQTRAFAYYDVLGEVKYAAQFYSRMLAPLELYAAEINDDGELVPTENEAAKAALQRIQDPGGGRTGLLGTYGRLMFLTGECYLFVTLGSDGEEQWEMLSTDELRPQAGSFVRYKAPSLGAEEYKEAPDEEWEPVDKTAVAYRLWKRHPRFSQLADSSMQGVLDLCEELVLLTMAVRSRARSRLAGSGVLLIDDRISPAPPEPVGDEDPAEDVFLTDLTEAMTSPIVDEGSASAVVPIILRVPGSILEEGGGTHTVADFMSHLQLVDPTQLYPETGLRTECIHRIAIGLDMPPEILEGLQDSNHWTAWQIDEQTWKGHGAPIAQQLVDDLSASFLRPELKSQGVPDWQRYRIAYDATKIINHPDRTKDAKDLYDREVIGKSALREAGGFDEDDAMPQDELDERLGLKLKDGGFIINGVPTVRSGPNTGQEEDIPPEGEEVGAADVEKAAPPPPSDEEQPGVIGSASARDLARIMGAADLALLRAREVAGNRLRALAKRDRDALASIDGVPAGQVAATLGREKARALGAPADADLVAGARPLILDALRMYHLKDDAVSTLVADFIEPHAARTLYDARPSPLPHSFENYVKGALALGRGREADERR